MAELGLLINKFSISRRNGEYYNLSTPFPENRDILDQFEIFLQSNTNIVRDDSNDHAMSMGRIIEKATIYKEKHPFYKYVYFSISYGQYGTSATIKEVDTGKKVFNLLPEHAPTRDYRVFMAMPYGERKLNGIIIFETISGSSVKTMFSQSLKKYAHILDEKYTFKMNPLATDEEIKALIGSSRVSKVRLIKYYESQDHIDSPYTKEERIFFNPIGKLCTKITKMIFSGHMGKFEIAELDNFQANDMKVEFITKEGKPKTIGVKNAMDIGLTIIINEHPSIELDTGKLPTDKSLLKIMLEECENIIEKLT